MAENLEAFFSAIRYKRTREWKEEIVHTDLFDMSAEAVASRAASSVFPDGTPCHLPHGEDPRQVFADWLVRDDNPWFAEISSTGPGSGCSASGSSTKPDDIRPDNPASNPELLALLEHELVDSGYDFKQLLPPDPQLGDLPALLHPHHDRPRRNPCSRTILCAGWMRRY